MIKRINEDLLESGCEIIIHQVNCKGTMNTGIAKRIREKYPEVYRQYKNLCDRYKGREEDLLGRSQFVYAFDPDLKKYICIINLFAQKSFGKNGSLYTNYEAFNTALETLRIEIINGLPARSLADMKIGLPYLIGCKNDGGDWPFIDSIIDDHLGFLNIGYYKTDKK